MFHCLFPEFGHPLGYQKQVGRFIPLLFAPQRFRHQIGAIGFQQEPIVRRADDRLPEQFELFIRVGGRTGKTDIKA
jgi:hypothetical protein